MENVNGNLLRGSEDVRRRRVEYFCKLLNVDLAREYSSCRKRMLVAVEWK